MSTLSERLSEALPKTSEIRTATDLMTKANEFHLHLINTITAEDNFDRLRQTVDDARVSKMVQLIKKLEVLSAVFLGYFSGGAIALILLNEMDGKTTNEDKVISLIDLFNNDRQEMLGLQKELEEVLAELQAEFEPTSKRGE